MALTLAQIRAKLQEQAAKTPGQGGGDNVVYAHWDIPEGTTARVRFLSDADSNNPYFWLERAMIKLPFAGIKGQADSKQVYVQVPCIEMWPDMGMCPILAEVRPWFKDKSLEDMGRKYWKKKSYLMQGFVRESPMKEEKVAENPIRRFIMSPQIFNLVKAALMDPELENLPTDYASGLDFMIKKTSKGGYADYTTSVWARKESALNSDEAEAIEKHGLFNLNDFMPKRPSAEDLVIMKEMFEASVDGQPYDAEKWGKHFRPAGMQAPAKEGTDAAKDETPAPAQKPTPAPAKEAVKEAADSNPPWEDEAAAAEPVQTPAAAATGSRAEDIIAMIRNRNKPA